MKNPEISVAMGVFYKSENIALLSRSVESILNQSFENFELLICFKELSEPAKKYLNEISTQDKRVILIDGSRCNHLGGQLNLCIAEAKGEFIARMDDDDISHADRLEKQLNFLKNHTEFKFVGSNINLIREGKLVSSREFPMCPKTEDFLFNQPFVHPSLMFRKSVLIEIGGYSDEKFCEGCEDYELLLRLNERGFCGANLQEKLLDYTLPPKGKTKRTMRRRLNEARTRFVRFKALGLLPKAFFYVLKPIAVGILPIFFTEKLREIKNR